MFCRKKIASCRARLPEIKFRLGLFFCQFDHFHFIEFFLARHCHIPGCHTGLVARHKIFKFIYFLLLALVSCIKLALFDFVKFKKFVVVANIAV